MTLSSGESLTDDGITYQLTQQVTNRPGSTYENTVTFNDELVNIVGNNYTCTVTNVFGKATQTIYCKFTRFRDAQLAMVST